MSLEKDINEIKRLTEDIHAKERRFRASVYMDIFVPETDDLEKDREAAEKAVTELVDKLGANEEGFTPEGIFNPYVGGVAAYNPRNLLKSMDREI
jgi:hypothetical protein